jgi:DNA-binding NarL/FixJ family response regulator
MIRIAIVEDHAIVRKSLRAIIDGDPGCECVCAVASGEAAIKEIPLLRPEVILMDIQLPNLSGVECAARLKERLPAVFIIMVTVYEDADLIFNALRAGASGYLLKRSTPAQILAAVRDVREGGVPMTSVIARKVIGSFREQSMAAQEVDGLSPREREVLDLLACGSANKEIAHRLGISVDAVRWHLKHVYAKLHVRSRTEAVLRLQSGKSSRTQL